MPVVDLATERAARKPAVTRFVLEVRDAGSGPGRGVFLWDYSTEDCGDGEQWHPSTRQIGHYLRRIADRYDPPTKARRAKVTARAKGRR
jgi:hypothetical protein